MATQYLVVECDIPDVDIGQKETSESRFVRALKEWFSHEVQYLDWKFVDAEWYNCVGECSRCGLKQSVDQALNSGDGVYRP